MSTTILAYMVVGFRVQRSDFFEAVATERRCAKYHNAGSVSAKFCAECGAPMGDMPIERPTRAFECMAQSLRLSKRPELIWDDLQDGIKFDGLGSTLVGIFDVAALAPSERKRMPLAFGFRALSANSWRNTDAHIASDVSVGDIGRLADLARNSAADFGFPEQEIRTFLTLYYT